MTCCEYVLKTFATLGTIDRWCFEIWQSLKKNFLPRKFVKNFTDENLGGLNVPFQGSF